MCQCPLQYFGTVHPECLHCTNTVAITVFCEAIFCLGPSICIFFSFIYIVLLHNKFYNSGYVNIVLWYCILIVFALYKHCSGNSAFVRHFIFFFGIVATVPSSIIATVVTVFLSSVCNFFFPFIYIVLLHNKFIIFLQLLRYQFFISQNKIIKYEIVTNHN